MPQNTPVDHYGFYYTGQLDCHCLFDLYFIFILFIFFTFKLLQLEQTRPTTEQYD